MTTVDLGGSHVNIMGAKERTVAEMASRIYCELIVYHSDQHSREQAVAVALDLYARVKQAFRGVV